MTRKWFVALVLAASVALISCSPSGDTKLDGRLLQAGKPFSYQIQPLVESDEEVTYEATLADGAALPGWLKFDPVMLRFSGVAPVIGTNLQGTTYTIRVVAKGRLLKIGSRTFAMQVASLPTAVPEIVNPAEELQAFAPDGILRWTQVSGTDAYEVWTYRDPALTQFVEFSNQLTSRQYQFTRLAGDTTYFVKIYFRIGGSWREAPAFTLQTDVPVTKARLSNPQEELDAFSVGGLLRWSSVPNAERYELWVYFDGNLQTLAEASGPIVETQYRTGALTPGHTYYVQVYSRIGGVFHVGNPLPVTVVGTENRARILNPQEELDAFATNGTLRWTAVTGASGYEVWVFKNPSSSEIQESSGSLATRSYATRTLQPGVAYYVQVYALVNGQWQVGAPVKVTTVAQTSIARLTNAQEQLEAFSTDGTLTWSEVPGATAYEVHLFTNAGLGYEADTSGPTTSRSYRVRSLCSNATYYSVVYAMVGGQWTHGWALPVTVTQGTNPAGCVGPAPVITLKATPAAVTRRGDGVRVAWATQFASSCTAKDGSPGWAGPKAVSGDEATAGLNTSALNTKFTLECTGGTGTSRAQVLVGLKPPAASLHGQVIELSYDSLYDLFARRDPVSYPNPSAEPTPWDYQRILSDLNSLVRVDDYDFVLVYTSDQVAGSANSGAGFTVPAKNIGYDNRMYGQYRDGWTRLQRALYMNSADIAADYLTAALFGNAAVLTAFHEIGHHWGVSMARRACGSLWDASQPVAFLATECGHWSWAYYDTVWPENAAASIMWLYGPSGPKFNAFDLYVMGLMGYQEARNQTLKLRSCTKPADRNTCVTSAVPYRTLKVDDLIEGLRISQPAYYFEGDGHRIPDTDPAVAHLSVLIVAVSGTNERLSDRGLNALQRVFAEIPDAWQLATWNRSTMNVGQASSVVPGIWVGVVHDAVRSKTWTGQCIVTDAGRTDCGWLDPVAMSTVGEFFGTMFAAGNDATANLTGIAETDHGYKWNDGSVKAQFTFSGSIVPRTSFIGTYTGGGEHGTFDLRYDAVLWERSSSLEQVAGNYQDDSGWLSVTIGSDGMLAGGTTYGCGLTGAVRVVNPARNYYDVEMNISGCNADYPDGRYTGIALLADYDAQHPSSQFMFSVNNGSVIFSGDPHRVTDGAVASIAIADDTNQEGDPTPMQFVVSLNRAMATPVTVAFATTAGTATAGVDFAPRSGVLTFPAGTTSRVVEVPILDDAIGEANETFTVQLSNPSANATIADGAATGTIFDNDGSGPVGITIADTSLTEGNAGTTLMHFTVSLDRAPSSVVVVDFRTISGTATAGSDYLPYVGNLSIPAGAKGGEIIVTILGDTTVEPNETFTVQLSNPSANATIVDGLAVGTIRDDDAAVPPTVKVSIADASVLELDSGSHAMLFTITFDTVPTSAISFDINTVHVTTTAADFTAVNPPVSFPAGASTVQTFTGAMVIGDTTPEPDETFELRLSNPSLGVQFLDAVAVGTIRNDDGAAVSQVTIGDAEVMEGNSGTATMTFPLTISPASSSEIRIYYETVQDMAMAGTDYTHVTGTVTVPANTSNWNISIPTIKGDISVENDETMGLRVVSQSANAAIKGGDNRAIGIIRTDDRMAIVKVLNYVNIAPEGDSDWANGMAWTVRLVEPVTRDVRIYYYTLNGTASAVADYHGVPQTAPGSVTIPAGQTEATILIGLVGDTVKEPLDSETFQVRIYEIDNNADILWRQANLTGVIIDDEARPGTGAAIHVDNDTGRLLEGDAGSNIMRFSVWLEAASSSQVRVNYTTSPWNLPSTDGSSSCSGVDYVNASDTLVFEPGETRKYVDVRICGDTVPEGDEVFGVQLSGAINGYTADPSAVGVIEKDDNYSVVWVEPAEVIEGPAGTGTALRFTVRRDAGLNVGAYPEISVRLTALADRGTASTPADYAWPGTQTLVFSPGQLARTFEIPVVGDGVVEGDETVMAVISPIEILPSYYFGFAAMDRYIAIGTIRDDD